MAYKHLCVCVFVCQDVLFEYRVYSMSIEFFKIKERRPKTLIKSVHKM